MLEVRVRRVDGVPGQAEPAPGWAWAVVKVVPQLGSRRLLQAGWEPEQDVAMAMGQRAMRGWAAHDEDGSA